MSVATATQTFGAVLTLAGTGKVASAQKAEGRAARSRGYEQQSFNEIAAGQMRAVGQRAALEEGRQAEIIASRAVAVAAAGGSVSDITHLIADIYGEGAYRASVALHDAETQARRLEFEGEQAAKYGEDVYDASKKKAKGTKMGGLGSVVSFAGGLL
jgi:hypothetical protein